MVDSSLASVGDSHRRRQEAQLYPLTAADAPPISAVRHSTGRVCDALGMGTTERANGLLGRVASRPLPIAAAD
jgi:hypothetical protein